MIFDHRAFWLPKDLAVPDAYEDAYSFDAGSGRAAVCDGVAAGMFSGAWARILAGALAAGPPPADDPSAWNQWLAACRAAWKETVSQVELAWHQKAKLEEGAAATALWVELALDTDADGCFGSNYQLTCRAVGDCCLLHVRDGHVLKAFPLDASSDYQRDPVALSSRNQAKGHTEIEQFTTGCEAGDLLVLTTDALAAWALRQLEAGEAPPFAAMWDWPEETWREFIVELRGQHRIRHDDTTLLLLRLLPCTAPPPPSSGLALDRIKESAAGWLRRISGGQ